MGKQDPKDFPLLGSASRLSRTIACPAAGHLPGTPEQEDASSEAAKRGQRLHAALEVAPEDYDQAVILAANNHRYFKMIDIRKTAGYYTPPHLRELKFKYNIQRKEATLIEHNSENRDYGDVGPYDVPGTADVVLVGVGSKTVEVWDYKTGRWPVSPDGNPQLLHNLLCASKILAPSATRFIAGIQQFESGGKVVSRHVELDRLDIEDFEHTLEESATRAVKALEVIDNGGMPEVTSGDHCKWCPSLTVCPKWRGEEE